MKIQRSRSESAVLELPDILEGARIFDLHRGLGKNRPMVTRAGFPSPEQPPAGRCDGACSVRRGSVTQ